jgi:hypothetical protein
LPDQQSLRIPRRPSGTLSFAFGFFEVVLFPVCNCFVWILLALIARNSSAPDTVAIELATVVVIPGEAPDLGHGDIVVGRVGQLFEERFDLVRILRGEIIERRR